MNETERRLDEADEGDDEGGEVEGRGEAEERKGLGDAGAERVEGGGAAGPDDDGDPVTDWTRN